MRWIKTSGFGAMLGFGILSIVPLGAAHAEPIVIKYEGPASQLYKPGKKLQSSAKISLKAGEVLTVLDERGTRTLRGPGTFSASSATSASSVSNTSLARLVKTGSVRRARTGAVRGDAQPQAKPLSPNLWFVDIGKSARFCVADFENLQLWRANGAESQQVTATDGASGQSASVRFGKGATTMRWPSAITPRDGGTYTLAIPGRTDKVSLEFVKVNLTGGERIDLMASKLIEKGCQAQSELLAATFAQADPAPSEG
jgi:hypothetical protein